MEGDSGFDMLANRGWLRRSFPVFFQAVNMKQDGIADVLLCLRYGISCCDTAGKIGNVGGKVSVGLLDYDSVAH